MSAAEDDPSQCKDSWGKLQACRSQVTMQTLLAEGLGVLAEAASGLVVGVATVLKRAQGE